MENAIRFIVAHYEVVFSLAFSLIAFIVSVRSYFKNRSSAAFSKVLSQIPVLCCQIESLFPHGNGAVKLEFVLAQLEKLCKASSIFFDRQFFTEYVEKVLAAPCKSDNKEV